LDRVVEHFSLYQAAEVTTRIEKNKGSAASVATFACAIDRRFSMTFARHALFVQSAFDRKQSETLPRTPCQ
jgi:hypothetical protein